MKLILFSIISTVIVVSCKMSVETKTKVDEVSEILSLELKWLKAEFDLDTAYLSSIIDSSFISISDEGIKNKQEDILSMYNNIAERVRDSIFIDSFRLEDSIVKIYDNTAIATFIVHSFGKNKLQPRERRTRFYDIWVKRNERWMAVSSQGTPVE